jgi:tetratricopeptide (TPR) repeat protein
MESIFSHVTAVAGRTPVVLIFAILLTVLPAAAQPGQEPREPENLQVLPEDITEEQLRGIMESFEEALGVGCTHCHVREPGQPPRMNFAVDDKPEKETARAMMKMVQAINGEYLTDLPSVEGQSLRVTCVTCHHGLARPRLLEDQLAETFTTHGLDSTFTQYEELRGAYYGTFAYDFSDGSLVRLSELLVEQDKAADALTVLERNLEMFPESVPTFLAMSDAYVEMGNTAEAIRSLERAQEIEPNNFRLRRQLEALRGQ